MNTDDLARKIRLVSQRSGSFLLRSGTRSDTYFDKYQFESDPAILLDVAHQMARIVPADAEVLAGLEMGGIPLAVVLGQILNLPTAFVRKKAKEYGTQKYAEGPALQGKKVVLIEDVVTSGGAIIEAVQALRRDGVDIDLALCVIDRQSGGTENLYNLGVKLKSVFLASELLDDRSE